MRIVVLGATGYVGSRLVPALLSAGHDVVAASSSPVDPDRFAWGHQVTWRQCDVTDDEAVDRALRDADGVLLPGAQPEPARLRRSRPGRGGPRPRRGHDGRRAPHRLPLRAGAATRPRPGALPHLASRLEVEQILAQSDCSTLSVRAGVVIGAGSTSYEVVRQLASLLLVQPVPTWMRTKVQPVAVTDVIRALVAAFEADAPDGDVDLGGPDVVRYPELLAAYSRAAGPLPPARAGPGRTGHRRRALDGPPGRSAVSDRHGTGREPSSRHGVPPRPPVGARRRADARRRGGPGPLASDDTAPTSPRRRCRATSRGPACAPRSSTSCAHLRCSERAPVWRCGDWPTYAACSATSSVPDRTVGGVTTTATTPATGPTAAQSCAVPRGVACRRATTAAPPCGGRPRTSGATAAATSCRAARALPWADPQLREAPSDGWSRPLDAVPAGVVWSHAWGHSAEGRGSGCAPGPAARRRLCPPVRKTPLMPQLRRLRRCLRRRAPPLRTAVAIAYLG